MGKSSRRSQAAGGEWWSGSRRGTGYRHAVQEWPISALTGRRHKLVLPAESPAGNKFLLVVGDSHLRSLVDGFVKMPEGRLSFGFMSTPGASQQPDCQQDLCEAGVDFAFFYKYVMMIIFGTTNLCVCVAVVVLDFPPHLTADADHQKLMREEFHRVAARMGVKYLSTAEHFPLDCPGICDSLGMPILSQLFWQAAYVQLEAIAPTEAVPPRVSPRTSPPRFCPRIFLKGEVIMPRRSNPFEWTVVGQGKKEVEQECSIPLNPVWFSSAVMDAMDAVVPSHLSSPVKSSDAKRTKVILFKCHLCVDSLWEKQC
uniref:Uncharacterized protein n=1 Tax=Scophthalmus maximus TaxID=52904 RepID=A0A8D3DIW2_SCOMX